MAPITTPPELKFGSLRAPVFQRWIQAKHSLTVAHVCAGPLVLRKPNGIYAVDTPRRGLNKHRQHGEPAYLAQLDSPFPPAIDVQYKLAPPTCTWPRLVTFVLSFHLFLASRDDVGNEKSDEKRETG